MTTVDEASKQIIDRALEHAQVTAEQLAEMSLVQRFALGEMIWEIKTPAPVPGYICFAIFEGNTRDPFEAHLRGDVRIFCIPANHGVPYARFTLSRVAPTSSRTNYKDVDAFAREIAAEWDGLAEALDMLDDDDDDDLSVTCGKCGHETAVTEPEADDADEDDEPEDVEPAFCGHCGERLITVPTVGPESTEGTVVS